MKELFIQRSHNNIKAAQLLSDAGLHDACANRIYYAVFDAAFVACMHYGVKIEPEHAKVLSAFCGELIARKKLFPASVKESLYELQKIRIKADYGEVAVSKTTASNALKTGKQIVYTVLERIVQ